MEHTDHDRSRKKQKVQVQCGSCPNKFEVRQDVSRPWYRTYKGLGPFKCILCRGRWTSNRNKAWKGPANPNWKGGKTSEIQKFYNSPEWKELRTKVFIRDNYTCRDCPQRGGQLEANHIKAR
jgi:hypothetical protein